MQPNDQAVGREPQRGEASHTSALLCVIYIDARISPLFSQ